MKVLFLYPNKYLSPGINTGISILSAVLKQENIEVSLFDYTFVKTKESHKNISTRLAVYLPTEISLESLVKDDPVESLEESFERRLEQFPPDLIALSAMTGTFDMGINLLKKFKSKLKCKVIVGGVHATIAPEDALTPDIVDFICVGEGEGLMVELCDCLGRGKDYRQISNLAFKKKSGIQVNKLHSFVNLDELPTPDWSIFDSRHLFRPFMGNVYQGSFYIMSRGCPYNCSYCVSKLMRQTLKESGSHYRFQHPTTTIRHLSDFKKRYNATWFKFADDSIMSMSEKFLEELAEGLAPLKINFGCSVRPETTTDRKVALLKQMGCVAMSFGIESGNEELRRKVLNRTALNKQIEQAIMIINNYGIRISTFNMIGLPEETRDNVFETIRFNKKLNIEAANIYCIYPYPGTEVSKKYNTKLRDGKGEIILLENASVFALSKMPPLEVEGLLKTFNLYMLLPEELWPVIRYAEKNTEVGMDIFAALVKCSRELLKKKHSN